MIVGVGVDLVDIARVRRLIASKGDRALRRLFTELECDYSMSHALPFVHLAARVAAKEAAFKALSGSDGARAIGWREMEVRTLEHGRPSLVLHGMAEQRAAELGVTSVWLSLSHSDLTAGAVVVLEAK